MGDEEIKSTLAAEHPYDEWLHAGLVPLETLPDRPHIRYPHADVVRRQLTFGYTNEDLRILMAPMARTGGEALGSMGTDTPVAVLSDRPRLLFDYFTQLFAQVTNPPLDAIREELVTSLMGVIGPEANLLDPTPASCRQVLLRHPILDNDQLAKLVHINGDGSMPGLQSVVVGGTYPVADGGEGLRRAIERVRSEVSAAIAEGARIIVLSDRGVTASQAPIPSLLLTSAVHHHLVREKTRTQVGLVIESGDAREVHHMCLLLGYGASAINPYMAFETLEDMCARGALDGVGIDDAVANYIKACGKGVLKVMSKMGISTVASYTGAQVFEAIGLGRELVDEYFTLTASRLGGVGLDVLAAEVAARHAMAHAPRPTERAHRELEVGGEYQWRREGEHHLFNPETVFKLQHASRAKRFDIFKEYTRLVDDQSTRLATLRGLFELKADGRTPVPIDEVEPASAIIARFSTGAMCYGSISAEAHETLAIAMNRLGGKSNTGEGGEDAERFIPLPDGSRNPRRSAIKQVASGRFGVTAEYLTNSDDIQIKMAQGAKPGEGGQLPGHKVYPWVAKTRYSTPGVGLISPPPHHDIYSIEDLAQLIHDLKNANPSARVHVKLVSEVGRRNGRGGRVEGPRRRGADLRPRRRHRGQPADVAQARRRSLGARPGRDPADPAAQRPARPHRRAGRRADEDRPRRDHRCPARGRGVRLRHRPAGGVGLHHDARLPPRHLPGGHRHPEPRAAQALRGQARVRRDVLRVHRRGGPRAAGRAGLPQHRRGRRPRRAARHPQGGRPLEGIGPRPQPDPGQGRVRPFPDQDLLCTTTQDHGLDRALDVELIAACREAIDEGTPVTIERPIRNVNRTVGTMLGHEVTKAHGGAGLPDDTIDITFTGSAGQSFGAFLPSGITLRLYGDANDYVGKGLSGGRIIVRPSLDAPPELRSPRRTSSPAT